MSWFFYSILASLSFSGMVLCISYLGKKGFSPKYILFFLFAFAFLEYLLLNIGTINAILKSEHFVFFLIIITIASIFSVIGNWAHLTAIVNSPNPGFAVAIKNSNVLLIAPISFLVFGSSLSMTKLIGALIILGGFFFLVLEKKDFFVHKTKRAFLRWKKLAIIAALSFIITVLGKKKAGQMGFQAVQINLFSFGFNFLAFTILNYKEIRSYFRDKIQLKFFLPIVFLAATLSFLANIFDVKGIITAPNPAYHESIKNTHILLTTLFSVPLLGSSLSKQKLLGVVFILIGIIFMII